MKKTITCILLCILFESVIAQDYSKRYSTGIINTITDLKFSKNDDLLIAGYYEYPHPDRSTESFVSRINSLGDIKWTVFLKRIMYGGAPQAARVSNLTDSSVYAYANNILCRMSPAGQFYWKIEFHSLDDVRLLADEIIDNEDIILYGRARDTLMLARIDSSGTMEWSRKYNLGREVVPFNIFSNDSGYLLTGAVYDSSLSMWMVFFGQSDFQGNLSQGYRYTASGYNGLQAVSYDSSSNAIYFISRDSTNWTRLLKINGLNGNIIWGRQLEIAHHATELFCYLDKVFIQYWYQGNIVVVELDSMGNHIGNYAWGDGFSVNSRSGPFGVLDNIMVSSYNYPPGFYINKFDMANGPLCSKPPPTLMINSSFGTKDVLAYSQDTILLTFQNQGTSSLWNLYTLDACLNTNQEEIEYADAILLFPDPATEYITVRLPEKSKSFRVDLYSILGEQVDSRESDNQSGGLLTFRLSGLPAGVYFVSVLDKSGERIYSSRFIKQ